MTFERFSELLPSRGLQGHDCGGGHWQIRGGKYIVNFYRSTKRGPVVYINGTKAGIRCSIVEQALKLAIKMAKFGPSLKQPDGQNVKRLKSQKVVRLRRALFAASNLCYWCSKELSLHKTPGQEQATLDHIIPISRGGSNGQDNQVLACTECNQRRGNSIANKTPWECSAVTNGRKDHDRLRTEDV